MSRGFLFVLIQLIGISLASNVIELNSDTFDSLVNHSKSVWIVEFYSPTCPYCQEFAPEYEATADGLQGNSGIKVGRVDATRYSDLGGKYGIRGYPTVKMFHPDRTEPTDYQGPRTASNLISAARSFSQGKRIRRMDNDGFVDGQEVDRVVKLLLRDVYSF